MRFRAGARTLGWYCGGPAGGRARRRAWRRSAPPRPPRLEVRAAASGPRRWLRRPTDGEGQGRERGESIVYLLIAC